MRVGHALGGTDLPTTKADTLDCLKSYLPRLAVTHGMAMSTGANLPMPHNAIDWAIRDTMPKWAKELISHRDPNIVQRTARRAAVWSIINGLHIAAGPAPEFRQAQARVKSGTTVPHTLPTYVLGDDPVRTAKKWSSASAETPPRRQNSHRATLTLRPVMLRRFARCGRTTLLRCRFARRYPRGLLPTRSGIRLRAHGALLLSLHLHGRARVGARRQPQRSAAEDTAGGDRRCREASDDVSELLGDHFVFLSISSPQTLFLSSKLRTGDDRGALVRTSRLTVDVLVLRIVLTGRRVTRSTRFRGSSPILRHWPL